MQLDTKSLAGYFSKDRKLSSEIRDGFISPPLSCRKAKAGGGGPRRRIAIVGLLILTLLYFCGFSIPGYGQSKDKVVIILAANLGGGILAQRQIWLIWQVYWMSRVPAIGRWRSGVSRTRRIMPPDMVYRIIRLC